MFFFSNGFNVPENYNPSDFYTRTLSIMPAKRDECKALVEVR